MRGSLLALLIVLPVVAAGCVTLPTADIDSNANDLPDAAAAARAVVHSATGILTGPDTEGILGAARLLYLGHDAVEPTLGITSDGTLFYAAGTFAGDVSTPVATLPKTNILRSKDGGVTWEDVTPRIPVVGMNNPPATFDPYVFVDPDTDRVFSIDLEALLCAWLSYSDDLGETWITNPVGCGHPVGVHDHQTLFTGKPRFAQTVGYPNVVYYCVNRVADSVCAASLNGGLSFGPLVPVYPGVENNNLCGGLHAHGTAAPDGAVYLGKGQCGVPEVAMSRDDGLTWTRVVVNADVGILGHELNTAVDEAGNVYAFWMERDGRARLATSTDGGYTWGPAHDVTHPDVTAITLPTLTAGSEGMIAFAYAGTEHPGGYADNRAASDWENATWNGYLAYVLDALADEPTVVTLLVNDPEDPLVRGRCGPGRCPGMYDFIDVVIDKEGRAWAAFVDACVGKCATPEGTPQDSRAFEGVVAAVEWGPSLRGGGALVALPPLPAR